MRGIFVENMEIPLHGEERALGNSMQILQPGKASPAADAESSIRRVLLVDDEPSIVDLFGMILRNAGYFVRTALNGAAGLTLFESASWDLVITDRQMPQMDGERLAEEIKGIAPETPVILITGISNGDLRPGLFDAVLRKPFSKAALLASVKDILMEDSTMSLRREA
jgi:CheY-like chemotaxis protein